MQGRLTVLFDTPRKSRLGFKSDLFDLADIYNGPDLDLLWMTLTDVAYMADRYRNTAPESHWIAAVVAPLLHLVRRLSCLNSDGGNRPSLEVLDMYDARPQVFDKAIRLISLVPLRKYLPSLFVLTRRARPYSKTWTKG